MMATSKLNRVESKISEALIYNAINQEDFMKKNINEINEHLLMKKM